MSDQLSDQHGSAAGRVYALRRGAHGFLCHRAAHAWQYHDPERGRLQILMPPAVQALPEGTRFGTHARQEARRVAEAQVYALCPQASAAAVQIGAGLRQDRHERAVAVAGQPDVVDTAGIWPPAPFGFLHWQDPQGVGHGLQGAPIIACHWGRLPDSAHWLVWWSDTTAVAHAYAADARAARDRHSAETISSGLLTTFGPLWYDDQQLLLAPRKTLDAAGERGVHSDHDDGSGDDVAPSALARLYTTLGAWALLTHPDTPVELTQQPPPDSEAANDRAAGLHPRLFTLAALTGTR